MTITEIRKDMKIEPPMVRIYLFDHLMIKISLMMFNFYKDNSFTIELRVKTILLSAKVQTLETLNLDLGLTILEIMKDMKIEPPSVPN